VAGEDEIRVSATLTGDINAALTKMEDRINAVENALQDMGRAGQTGGRTGAEGLDKLGKSSRKTGDESETAKRKVKGLGDEAEKTGAKSAAGSKGLDEFAKKAKKMGGSSGGISRLLTFYKFAGVATGLFAAAGGLSAVGAGSVIALAHLAPLALNLLNLGPIGLAFAASMAVIKLSAQDLQGPLTRIKQQFVDIGSTVANAGLAKGMDSLATSIAPAVKVIGTGLSGISAELGGGATQLGKWSAQTTTLAYLSAIFAGLRPIVNSVLGALLSLLTPALALIKAIIPVSQMMAANLALTAAKFGAWVQAASDSGKITGWLTQAWYQLQNGGHALWNILVGLFNIFHIAYGVVNNFGMSMFFLTVKFKEWTQSAEGQKRITKYFQDALPALHEMGLILSSVISYLGHLSGSMNIAPLLQQIRVELLPAIYALLNSLTQKDGLGPVLIDTASNLALLFSGSDFSGFIILAKLADDAAGALLWMQNNVPGANVLISALLFSLFGFKLLAPVWAIVAKGYDAFKWIKVATSDTKELTLAQKLFSGGLDALPKIGGAAASAFSAVGSAIADMGAAALANPIVLIVVAIIAVIAGLVLLYMKCEWFRNAVNAIFQAIADFAVMIWNGIVTAFWATLNWIVGAAQGVAGFFVGIWNAIAGAAVAAWNWIANIVSTVIGFIVGVVMTIWTVAVQPVLNFIMAAFSVYFTIISFIVQTAVYIIVAIVVLIAIAFKALWDGIVFLAQWAWQLIVDGAMWLWNNGIKPVIDGIVNEWNQLVQGVTDAWNWMTAMMSALWNAFYTTYIQPVIDGITSEWNDLVTGVSDAWNWVTSMMSAVWNEFYNSYIKPVIDGISSEWNDLTTGLGDAWQGFVDFINPILQGIGDFFHNMVVGISKEWDDFTKFLGDVFTPVGHVVGDIWDGIQKGANAVVDAVKGAWNGLMDVVKGVWNFIANGWNDIPSITVPDWIPVIGGETFSLPKLPTLWHGGRADGGSAIVGEHGPEPLVVGGSVRMVGMGGPEIANIPRGGYVVPNLNTLNALPGLTKSIPASVASAVARSIPSYAGALGPAPARGGDGGLARSVDQLARAVTGQLPSVTVNGDGDGVERKVLSAIKTLRREDEARGRYNYTAGNG
jgi:phage-related protein